MRDKPRVLTKEEIDLQRQWLNSSGAARPASPWPVVPASRWLATIDHLTDQLAAAQRERDEILSLVRRTRMDHGTCQPRERKACTACNAADALTAILAKWKGGTVSLAVAQQGAER